MLKHSFVLAASVTAALTLPALADHIPDHDNSDPVFPVPLPGQKFFDGGVLFVTAIGPLEGTEITNTTFDITWVSDGTTPASDLMIEVGISLDSGFMEFEVHGSDLGFGSGPGTFTGTFSTDALNGVVQPGFFPPNSIVHLTIGSITGGIEGSGYFENSFINFDVVNVPTPGALALLGLGAFARRRRRT